MQLTSNYGFKKPEGHETVNIDDLNHNADVMDTQLKKLNDGKVDKVAGKQLSTNDYTTAEKNKLNGIAAGAQVNAVTSVAGKTGAVTVTKNDIGLGNAENTSDLNKPISTATQNALNTKFDKTGGTITGDVVINKGVGNLYFKVPDTQFETAIRLNANSDSDYGLDIVRNGKLSVSIDRNGIMKVLDHSGNLFTLADLKSSVSNGKTLLANAITGKGVTTSASAEFATMAANIANISTGRPTVSGTTASVYHYGSGYHDNYVQVSGLPWKPGIVIIYLSVATFERTFYDYAGTGTNYVVLGDNDNHFGFYTIGNYGTYINNTGFRFEVRESGNYNWIAIL